MRRKSPDPPKRKIKSTLPLNTRQFRPLNHTAVHKGEMKANYLQGVRVSDRCRGSAALHIGEGTWGSILINATQLNPFIQARTLRRAADLPLVLGHREAIRDSGVIKANDKTSRGRGREDRMMDSRKMGEGLHGKGCLFLLGPASLKTAWLSLTSHFTDHTQGN